MSSSSSTEPIILGVAAMERKARSKPMHQILNRMLANKDLNVHIVIFGDKVLLDEPAESWPIVDVLISFFSTGFPMDKAIKYVDLRKPVCVNDLRLQKVLWDRRGVLAVLDSVGVPTPPRLELNRDGGPSGQFDELITGDLKQRLGIDFTQTLPASKAHMKDDDTLVIDGKEIKKPYVEKPVSGEDHNIHIYFPKSRGGGGRKLFRKVGNKSSEFDPNLIAPRTEGSYIYESFMDVDNAEDIKVYTIGPYFVHAETRKSPVVDGLVKRNPDGKEIRYITKLTEDEVRMATNISKAFKQNICGFDLLRVGNKSFVIDVNGWSFVKGNDFYYDKCAEILAKFCRTSAPKRPLSANGEPAPRDLERSSWTLKANVTVFRHGDRTPKQKLKRSFKATDPWAAPLLDLLQGRREEIILRQQLDLVSTAASKALKLSGAKTEDLQLIIGLIEKKGSQPGTKIQMKPSFNKETKELEKMQLIIKWGGEFSHAARHQAKDFGQNMRRDLTIMCPAALKNCTIYTSSERRVTASAEIFAAALLEDPEASHHEPLQLVIRKDLLDDSNAAKDLIDHVKEKLKVMLRPDSATPAEKPDGWPEDLPAPAELSTVIAGLLKKLCDTMKDNFQKLEVNKIQSRWCTHENPTLFRERWEKLFSDYEEQPNDPSRTSELFDMLSHDGLHNRTFIEKIFADSSAPADKRLDALHQLYRSSLALFSYVCPREYGITPEEKASIGLLTSMPLLQNIVADLRAAADTKGLCALYFTKESHIWTLLSLVLASDLPIVMDRIPPLDYFSSITFEVYERSGTTPGPSGGSSPAPGSSSASSVDAHSDGKQDSDAARTPPAQPERSLLISLSEGAHSSNVLSINLDARHALTPLPRRPLTTHMDLDDAIARLSAHSCSKIGDTDRGQVEGAAVYFGEKDEQQALLNVRQRRESGDTDRTTLTLGT